MPMPENGPQSLAIRWPVPKNNRGGEFSNIEEMLAHLEGEAAGHWLIGRNGMWHGGIHITDTTTPWCALSGQAMNEAVDFPVPFQGEQAVRCMADGEVVAYRINRDYLSVPWYWGDLHYSGSFVLVRHRIQPGKTAESELTFYTLYMHLAPWLAYPEQDSTAFKVADGQHLKAYVDTSRQWVAAELPPGTRMTWNKAVHADTLIGANGRQYAHVTLEEPVTGNMSLNAGDQVWTVCDRGNLVPARDSATRPAWWSPFLPPSRETIQFDTVVCPAPYPIKAGDPVGHLGYFQVPSEVGHEKRYQVHIECLTADDLPRFLSNPEGVGRETPAFARYPKDIPVYLQFSSGEIQKGLITTTSDTVMALSGQAVTDKEGKRYWPDGSSRGLLAESDLQLLSRYDLAGRGFETTEDSPASFDHLDGKTQPKGLVKKIFERFFSVADNDAQPYSKAEAFNYRQLLDKIDDGKSTWFNAEQYRRAVQNRSMHDHLNSLCVKHPSDWYYSSETPVWKTFFTPQLKKEAPEWYAYSMKFLTDIRWMYRVAGMVENPWHMHPLVFLDAIRTQVKILKGKLTYNAEGNDISSSPYYSRVIHWPGNALSGVTLGRGYDLGERSESAVYHDMVASGISDDQAAKISQGAGLKGCAARDFVALNKTKIGEITLQQQEVLFSIVYPKYIDRAIANYSKWTNGVSGVKPWDALHAQIQEVLVDFVYQGFTKGPKPMLAGSNNSKKELIDYIRNTPAISQYEPGRHRADYLEGEK